MNALPMRMGVRMIPLRNMSEREKLTKEYIKKMEEGSRNHTMEGLQRNMKTFGLIILENNLDIVKKCEVQVPAGGTVFTTLPSGT